jgi:1-acyl-sn-glycerol-3-phosphate acyltransferase
MLRLLVILVVVIPVTVWHAGRAVWAAYRKADDLLCVCDSAPRRWARFLLACAGTEVVLENAGVIDPDRPQILVANHVSWFDVLALAAALPGRYLFVAKRELEKIPLFAHAARSCGHIFIDRRDRNRAVESLETARERLDEESPTIIMFPEGTRSPTGALQPFKKGAFVLAIQTGVDIVPAAISGSREVMRKHSLLIRPGTIRVRFGDPIHVAGLDLDDRNQLTARAHGAVAALQAGSGEIR